MFDWKSVSGQAKLGIETGSKTEKCNYCGDNITQYQDKTVSGSNETIFSGWKVDLSKGLPETCLGKDCPIARIIRERG